ncbi:hypothetical protein BRX36_19850 [Sphingomonas sp. S-NIH.Pt1_0416]|uniref:hypothetical protein n=1 Tax=Sphingomonas sp. S-NIH.Pt1_0416 TaxID=1920123 RepID=UPI000F7D8745|nr:hypothetical protein [Sphingomonas sp. S-NIH.Pt1_0416]RSU58921.1 hypothetical protein BRX36_19850 [Sphingomonas sp. S-NIH.Pt1_0416]
MNRHLEELVAIRDGLREIEVIAHLCAESGAPGATKSLALKGIGAAIGSIEEHFAAVIEKAQSSAEVQP